MWTQIRDYILDLDESQAYKWIGGVIVAIVICCSIIIYSFYAATENAQKRLKRVNQLREEARVILEKHEMVKKQQQEVDTILMKDPAFKIKEYFTALLKELGLERNMTKSAEVSDPQDLNNGYSEVKLDAALSELNMKQLSNFLYKIEQNERIFTKELTITKALKSPTIDVTLVIATLQPQAT